MNILPFTLDEATEIAEDFEDMLDTEFTLAGVEYIVDGVVVSPHNDSKKAIFVDKYLQTGNTSLTLPNMDIGDYDVLLLLCTAADETSRHYMSISHYVKEKGVQYNFPTSPNDSQ